MLIFQLFYTLTSIMRMGADMRIIFFRAYFSPENTLEQVKK